MPERLCSRRKPVNRTHYQKPPRWYPPRLNPLAMRFWRPLRCYYQRRVQRLVELEVRGTEHIRSLLAENAGVLITPNHSCHADATALYAASDELGVPFYVMAAWQVLHFASPIKRLILRHHGVFSVDREGTDMAALRQAREVLESKPNPLVIFPEGEVYHINERVTPFREGPGSIALMAARKADRPVYVVPCAMRYVYTKDPTPELLKLMDELEAAVYWRPRPDLDLSERVYHLAEAALALKEIEFCGKTFDGRVPERITHLIECILSPIESRYDLKAGNRTVPERVKAIRNKAIKSLEDLNPDDPAREKWFNDLDDVFLVIQAFSYPGDYVAEKPTIERVAETLDKFEEDMLRESATIRGERKATIIFGKPISVPAEKGSMSGEELTNRMEQEVQRLLDECD